MENCLYLKKTICTFDLKDNQGYYNEDMVLSWKEAAAKRQLTCTECGAPVYLAAGQVKEPYFAHYDLEECDYSNGHETEELKKGKRLLYQLLKRSFPEADLQARFRLENGLYCTLYCILTEGRSFAVDYRLQNNSLEKFRERDTFYQVNKIIPIYILGKRQDKETKQLDWYQNLLQNSMGYLIYLDAERERLTLKKSFSYRLGRERRFSYCIQTYLVKDVLLNEEGQMICEFQEECSRIENQIQEEKIRFRKRQEQLKELREDKLRMEENYYIQQEAYHRIMEQEAKANIEQREPIRTEKSYDTKLEQEEQQADGKRGELHKSSGGNKTIEQVDISGYGLNPIILEKCRNMIAEGNAHLVAKKYYDAIMSER